ncbi:MAG: hypothetical protein BWY92_01609 [Firmicutes bacterium ADurb.BinA052]|nr:MAG: hypothetical protein BWY92_01609 [Firmicutes bacterium ADurb.BinA052]
MLSYDATLTVYKGLAATGAGESAAGASTWALGLFGLANSSLKKTIHTNPPISRRMPELSLSTGYPQETVDK